MSFQSGTLERMASTLFAPRGKEDMPVILCRRFYPHGRTYLGWDSSWEGLRKTIRNGKVAWEVTHDFNLRIELDNTCLIPDTPNNRERLEKMGDTVVEETHDPITGIEYNPPRKQSYPAMYSRVDKNMLEDSLLERLADMMEARALARGVEKEPLEYAESEDRRHSRDKGTHDVPVVAKKGRKTDPLLAPIRPSGRG